MLGSIRTTEELEAWHHAELDKLRSEGNDTPEACEALDQELVRQMRASQIHRTEEDK